jgi:glutamate racemase
MFMKIGIFDSGIGGEAVAAVLQESFPAAEIMCVNDREHMPYGQRSANEVIELTNRAIQPLLDAKCDAIVLACNTATTTAIKDLRTRYPSIKFIGFEPMIKPASLMTKTGRIAILATPATLGSNRYIDLKNRWAKNIQVFEPDCSNWAAKIESGQSDEIDINSVVKPLIEKDVDIIVLGCTHYHWIKKRIADAAGPTITVLEPSKAIADEIKHFSMSI